MVAPLLLDQSFDLVCEGPIIGSKQRFHVELSVDLAHKRWCQRPDCAPAALALAGPGSQEILMVRTLMKGGLKVEQRISYSRASGRYVEVATGDGKAKTAGGLCEERRFTPIPAARRR